MPTSLANLLYSLVAAIVLLVLGFVGGVKYEKGQEARAIVSEVKAEEKQHDKDVGTVASEGATYANQTGAPLATPAPVIRVCSSPRPVRSPAPSGPAPDAAPGLREPNTPEPAQDWDTTPTVTAGRDADAQVLGLQSYIRDVCLKHQ